MPSLPLRRVATGRKRPPPPGRDAVVLRARELRTTLPRACVADLTRRRPELALADFVDFAGPDADVVQCFWVPHKQVVAPLENCLEHLFHRAASKSRPVCLLAATAHLGGWQRGLRQARLPQGLNLPLDACLGARLRGPKYNKCALIVAPRHVASDASPMGAPSEAATMHDIVVFDTYMISPALRRVFLYRLDVARKNLAGDAAHTAPWCSLRGPLPQPPRSAGDPGPWPLALVR